MRRVERVVVVERHEKRREGMKRQAWMAGVCAWMVAALLLVSGKVFAQNEEAGGAGAGGNGPVRGEVVSIGIGGVEGKGGLYRPGAWVPVRVRLENRSGKVVSGRLGVEQPDLDGDKAMSVGGKFVLEPSAEPRDFWLYYWPRPDDDEASVKSILVLDETGTGQPVATISAPHGSAAADRIETKDFETRRSSRWVVVLGSKAVGFENFWKAWGGTEAVRMSLLPSANDLPDNVLGLEGVDVIVWEADEIKPSDLAPEFQMKAVLEWVQAGGHLIITAGQQAEELKRAAGLKDALPMEITGTREVDAKDVAGLTWTGRNFATKGGKISQLVGTVRGTMARAVQGTAGGVFADHPLAVTGVYGRGAVTLLTVDAAAPEMAEGLRGDMAMGFWSQIAGWAWQANELRTDAEYQHEKNGNLPDTQQTKDGVELQVDKGMSGLIDVTEVTQVRLLVAVLFLAVYWLLAGPIGYLILRAYKVVHWSWWVFGGSVVAASGLAAGVVMVLHLTSYDLRHKTVVLGAVNSRQVTAIGYYGVFAPASGQLRVEEPYSGGMSYLAPLCEPTDQPVQPFADPQPYVLYDDRAWGPAPVFRNTLKKMEGRWTGEREGLEGHAEMSGDPRFAAFTGELTNHTGYDLERVQVIVGGWSATSERTRSFVYDVNLGRGVKWGNGQRIDLATAVKPELGGQAAGMGAISLDDELRGLADKYSEAPSMLGYGSRFMTPAAAPATVDEGNDLLYVLLDAMMPRSLTDADRRNAVRGLARGMDATKLLDAAGGLVIARAGSVTKKEFVGSPVPLKVNGRDVAGRGDVLFVWALPLKASGAEGLGAAGGGAGMGGGGGDAK
ncbi:MAG TPA: hypothetical protein VH253_12800 [Phycisphaerae bacterium]|nr:hypothetical protein [Phycisphaerae bacterium]